MTAQPLIFELTVQSLPVDLLNFANNFFFTFGVFAALLGMTFRDHVFNFFENKRDGNFTTEISLLVVLGVA